MTVLLMGDWKTYKFSDFVEINPAVKLASGNEYSFIEMKDLNESNKFAFPSAKRVLSGGARFENGDTLFARITPCLENGKICQAKDLENGVGFGSTEFLVFRGRRGVSDSEFVYYLSRFQEVRKFGEKNMSGTSGRQRVSREAFNNLFLKLPPIEEQKGIAKVLSAFDDKIELNRRMNATLEAMARALFKAWFVDFEPVHANKENRPSTSASPEIAKLFPSDFENGIPKGWVKERISHFYEVGIGKTPPRREPQWFSLNPADVRWVSIRDMGTARVFSCETSEYLTEKAVKRFNVRVVPDMTVLLSFKLTVGRVCITDGICTTNEAIAHFTPRNPNLKSPFYLYEYLLTFDYQNLGSTSSIATAVNSQTIREIPFLLPSTGVANAFEKAVGALFARIRLNQQDSVTLTELRDSLLPRLISGKIRVTEETK